MAISIVAGSAVGASSSTSITKPTGYTVTAADVVLILIETGGNVGGLPTAPTSPAFTTVDSRHDGSGASQSGVVLAQRVLDGTEDWSSAWTWTQATGSGQFNVWSCIILRGADTTTPIDAHGTAGTSTGSSVSVAALTATVAGDALIIMVSDANDLAVSTWPSGVTEYAAASNATGNGVDTGTKTGLASGSTGTLTVSTSSNPGFLQALAALVKPSSATPVTLTPSGTAASVATGATANLLTTLSPSATAASLATGATALLQVAVPLTSAGTAAAIASASTTGLSGQLMAQAGASVASASTALLGVAVPLAVSGTAAAVASASAPAISTPVTLHPAGTAAAVAASQGATFAWLTLFYDDFLGSSVDTTKWNVRNDAQDPNETSASANNPANVSVAGSILTITGTNTSYLGQPYTGGMLDAFQKYYVRYGAMQFSAKMAHAAGLHPTIWLTNDNGQPASQSVWEWEIDVLEIVGASGPDCATHNVEPPGTGTDTANIDTWGLAFDPGAAFHTYRVEWTPTNAKFYADGALLHTIAYNVAGQMAPQINLSIGGSDAGGSPSAGTLPATLQVDYLFCEVPATSAALLLQSMALQAGVAVAGASTPSLNVGSLPLTPAGTASAVASASTAALAVAVPLSAQHGASSAGASSALLVVNVPLHAAATAASVAAASTPQLFNGLLLNAQTGAAVANASTVAMLVAVQLAAQAGNADASAQVALLRVAVPLVAAGIAAAAGNTALAALLVSLPVGYHSPVATTTARTRLVAATRRRTTEPTATTTEE